MIFLPRQNPEDINRLIFLWNGEYCDTKAAAEGFTVLNCDQSTFSPPYSGTAISCGMSGKATVTASSVKNDSFVCCIQREFVNSKGINIEPAEFCLPSYGYDITTALFAATANLIINGIFFQ